MASSLPSSYKIFVNIPVRNMQAAVKFYTAIGFNQNKDFTGEGGTMMVWSPDPEKPVDQAPISVMLLTHQFFETFLPSTHIRAAGFPNTPIQTQFLPCLGFPSVAAIDSFIGKAQAAGGIIDIRPTQSHKNADGEEPWMYGRAFTDPDGHIWETSYMNPENMPKSK